MTETLLDAVHDLVEPWTDVVRTGNRRGSFEAVDHEPLLVMLRNAVRSSTGRTSAGRTDDSARSIINMQAFTLWEQIVRDVRWWTRRYVRDTPNPMLGYAIRTLAERVDALWNQDQITEQDLLYLIRRMKGFRHQIWDLFNAPIEKELGVCPECEQGKVLNADGEMQTALIAFYRHGMEPAARCRHCGYSWVGEAQLVILGKRIGAELDVEALAEMGIKVGAES